MIQAVNKEPAVEFSQEIDGRIYTVCAFFKDAGETLQQKIERMIERDLATLIQESSLTST